MKKNVLEAKEFSVLCDAFKRIRNRKWSFRRVENIRIDEFERVR